MVPATEELNELLQSGYRFALSLTHDPAAADDLVQEACMALARNAGPWHRAYFFTTIRNRFIDEHRRRERRRERPMEDSYPVVPDTTDIVASREEVDHALAYLRPREREALYLSAVESYTAQEIADLTGSPRGTVLSLLHRAKGKLREILGPREVRGSHE